MNKSVTVIKLLAVFFVTLFSVACNMNDDQPFGTLSLNITDAPVDNATEVVVQVTGIELHGPDGTESFDFTEPMEIDLLTLTGTSSETLLNGVEVPAGAYQWIRLAVNAERMELDSYITLEDGSQHSLFIPSGSETGLKLNSNFIVPAGGSADFTIDFDLRKSVHQPEDVFGDYYLRPTLRLIDNALAGSISGTVSNALVDAACSPVVYLFADHDVTPDDEDENSPNPVTSAIPELNANTGHFDYEIGFVQQNDYTIAFSCDGELDDPLTDDAMTFTGTQNISVVAAEETVVNFE